ncbi:hypothetical protein GCM10009804_19560 [Kribbella hippodromi]|uniref:HEAT repeat protein n=1 Tax=Kribbella hippodromi TaxID=434347 RepID=A0ABP4NLV1_9ACTN
MVNDREPIDYRIERTDMLAENWARRLDAALGRPSGARGRLPLYRWTDAETRSAAHQDGSITLNQWTAYTMTVISDRQYNAQWAGKFRPHTAEDLSNLRAAVADFGDTYLELVQPADRTLDRAALALDIGVRANTVDVTAILNGMHNLPASFEPAGGIESQTGPDRHPLLQGAAAELTERVSRRVGMRPGEIDRLLRTVPPAGRFRALATVLVEQDSLHHRLPDGSRRQLPRDHVDRLKEFVAADLEATFDELGRLDPQNSRGQGERMVAGAMQNVAGFLRQPVQTEQAGYQQVASVMSAVQTELSQTRAPGIGVATLHLKFNTDYWSGRLRESVGDGTGAVGSDRSLTFDRDQVVGVLDAADTSRPPSPEVRSAVHTVGVQAARLCNPEAPGTTPRDATDQALDDQLTEDFATRQEPQLLAAIGYGPAQLGPEHSVPLPPTATAQVVAALTANAGRHRDLEPHEAAKHLLTTPPNERLDQAAAMSLSGIGSAVSPEVRAHATRTLATDLRAALTSAAEADRDGRSKLHVWSRSSAGEDLSQKVTAAVGKARKTLAGPGVGIMSNLQQAVSAATTGQAPPGGSRPGAEGSAPRQQYTGQAKSGQDRSGRS